MSRFATKSILAAAVTAASMTGSAIVANAADVIPEPPVIHVPEPMHKDIGFYIRGDVSGGIAGIAEIEFSGGNKYKHREVGPTLAAGVGVGARLHKYLRGDITAQMRFGGKVNGHRYNAIGSCPTGATYACYSKFEQKFKSQEFMANAYVDIGKFGHFKPYVGGGVGVARLKFDDYKAYVQTTGPCSPGCSGSDGWRTYKGAKDWKFAWNLQAGTTVTVNDKWDLDFGYKFTKIHGVNLTDEADTTIYHKADKMYFHDARVGFRYNF